MTHFNDFRSLDDDLQAKILVHSKAGNALMERGDWLAAIAEFRNGVELLPEPKNWYDHYMWLMAGIGDAYFMMSDYTNARAALTEAQSARPGQQNAFVQLRLGQSLFELGRMNRAEEHLMRAYLLHGFSIFDKDDPKYRDHMAASFNLR